MNAGQMLLKLNTDKLKEIFDRAERTMSMSNDEFWREQRIDQDLLKDDARESLLP